MPLVSRWLARAFRCFHSSTFLRWAGDLLCAARQYQLLGSTLATTAEENRGYRASALCATTISGLLQLVASSPTARYAELRLKAWTTPPTSTHFNPPRPTSAPSRAPRPFSALAFLICTPDFWSNFLDSNHHSSGLAPIGRRIDIASHDVLLAPRPSCGETASFPTGLVISATVLRPVLKKGHGQHSLLPCSCLSLPLSHSASRPFCKRRSLVTHSFLVLYTEPARAFSSRFFNFRSSRSAPAYFNH